MVSTTITFRTPLISIPRPEFADDVRRCWVANALSTVDQTTMASKVFPGVGAEAGGGDLARSLFENLLGPGNWAIDVPFRKWKDANGKVRTEGISTCAMTALGLGRRMMVGCADWMDGYADDIGTGFGVAKDFAIECGAWQPANSGARPAPGSVIQVLKPMHISVVVGWLDGETILTADGGQVGRKGLQACALRKRTVKNIGGKLFIGSREADGWLCPDLLEYQHDRYPITVPQHWDLVKV